MPPFNGIGAVLEGKFQEVIVVGCDSRYFARSPNQGGGLHQLVLRDGFGGAIGFPVGIIGGADPDRPGGGGLSAVMLAADGAGDQPCEGGCLPGLGGCVFLAPPLDLCLDFVEVSRGMMASWVSAA